MQPVQFPSQQPAGRSGLAPFAVVIVAIVVAAVLGLVFMGAIAFLMIRNYRSRSHFTVESMLKNPAFRTYHTLAESLPASHASAKDLVEMSHEGTVTVTMCRPYIDPAGYFKGYLEFGCRYVRSHGFNIGFASNKSSESGSFSTELAPNHMYFADYCRLKVGQRIVFEEIPTNYLPTLKLTLYSADPYLFVRPVTIR